VEGSEDVEDARATGIEDATRRDDGGGDDDDDDETKKKRAEETPSLRAPFVRRVGFCRNGVWQGLAFEPPACAPITAKNGAFHPSVSLYTHGKVGEHQDAKVAFNFGPTFVFPVSSFGDAPAPRPMSTRRLSGRRVSDILNVRDGHYVAAFRTKILSMHVQHPKATRATSAERWFSSPRLSPRPA
jgi:hypothetical protein